MFKHWMCRVIQAISHFSLSYNTPYLFLPISLFHFLSFASFIFSFCMLMCRVKIWWGEHKSLWLRSVTFLDGFYFLSLIYLMCGNFFTSSKLVSYDVMFDFYDVIMLLYLLRHFKSVLHANLRLVHRLMTLQWLRQYVLFIYVSLYSMWKT